MPLFILEKISITKINIDIYILEKNLNNVDMDRLFASKQSSLLNQSVHYCDIVISITTTLQ